MMTERVRANMKSKTNSKASTSPIIEAEKGEVLMDWYTAMREVYAGKKVTRREWDNESIFVFLQDDHLRIALGNGTISNLITRGVDMLSDDWFVV